MQRFGNFRPEVPELTERGQGESEMRLAAITRYLASGCLAVRKFDEQRKKIAAQIDRLKEDGESVRLGMELLSRPEQVREEAVEQLKKAQAATRKTKKAAGRESDRNWMIEMLEANDFRAPYQRWYSAALSVVEQLLPERYEEFRNLYRLDKPPKTLDVTTYTISDYIHGTTVPRENIDRSVAKSISMSKLKDQIDILASADGRLDSILADIEGGLQAALLDDELGTASELVRSNHLRSAGVVAGVVLERHLKSVVVTHKLKFRKKAQIGNLNDALKEAKVFDNPQWREVQRLADIRNLCAHDGERAPETEEVEELIRSTERIVKTVF